MSYLLNKKMDQLYLLAQLLIQVKLQIQLPKLLQMEFQVILARQNYLQMSLQYLKVTLQTHRQDLKG